MYICLITTVFINSGENYNLYLSEKFALSGQDNRLSLNKTLQVSHALSLLYERLHATSSKNSNIYSSTLMDQENKTHFFHFFYVMSFDIFDFFL